MSWGENSGRVGYLFAASLSLAAPPYVLVNVLCRAGAPPWVEKATYPLAYWLRKLVVPVDFVDGRPGKVPILGRPINRVSPG